jgi:hypothetical protein
MFKSVNICSVSVHRRGSLSTSQIQYVQSKHKSLYIIRAATCFGKYGHNPAMHSNNRTGNVRRLRLKCNGTRAETRFCLSTKRTSPFKSAGASVQSTTGSRAVHISLQGLYCPCKPVFCSHVTLTGYPHHSLVSPSLLLPCVTVCHHISNVVYNVTLRRVCTTTVAVEKQ